MKIKVTGIYVSDHDKVLRRTAKPGQRRSCQR